MSVAPSDVARGCRHAQLVAVVLVVAVLMCVLFVEMIAFAYAPFRGFAPELDLRAFRIVLGALAIMSLLFGRLLRDALGSAPLVQIAPTRNASPVTRRLFTESLISFGLSELIAFYGVVLFLLGGSRLDFYAFAVLSLAAFAMLFPRRSRWEDRARLLARRPAIH
jgi:hypothetical protein